MIIFRISRRTKQNDGGHGNHDETKSESLPDSAPVDDKDNKKDELEQGNEDKLKDKSTSIQPVLPSSNDLLTTVKVDDELMESDSDDDSTVELKEESPGGNISEYAEDDNIDVNSAALSHNPLDAISIEDTFTGSGILLPEC